MRDIINQHQAAILAVLEATVDAKHADVTEKTGIPPSTYEREMADLREREMIFGTRTGSKNIMRLSITMKGTRALHDHIEHQQKLLIDPSMAVPARINVMADDYPAWQPKPMTSCRNNGHRNIRSLGAFA